MIFVVTKKIHAVLIIDWTGNAVMKIMMKVNHPKINTKTAIN